MRTNYKRRVRVWVTAQLFMDQRPRFKNVRVITFDMCSETYLIECCKFRKAKAR